MKKYIVISSLIFVSHAALGMDNRETMPSDLSTPPRTKSARNFPISPTSPEDKYEAAAKLLTSILYGVEVTPKRDKTIKKTITFLEQHLPTERARKVRKETKGLNPCSRYNPETYQHDKTDPNQRIPGVLFVANTKIWAASCQKKNEADKVKAHKIISKFNEHDWNGLKPLTKNKKRKIDTSQQSILGFTKQISQEKLEQEEFERSPQLSEQSERSEKNSNLGLSTPVFPSQPLIQTNKKRKTKREKDLKKASKNTEKIFTFFKPKENQ